MRSLGPEEKALWDRVAATIRPLSRQPTGSSPDERAEPPARSERAAEDRRTSSPGRQPLKRPPPPAKVGNFPTQSLDSHWDRRLRSGEVQPDRVLDLHGMTLDTAWSAIDRALERAIAEGGRTLLLITGHARPGDPPVERGRIRAAVHDWLAASRHSSSIAAVRGAHRRHGGGGSLYIILRRKRSGSTIF